jgi:uncharacterized protein involved in exopolysaccharide biosynthesis
MPVVVENISSEPLFVCRNVLIFNVLPNDVDGMEFAVQRTEEYTVVTRTTFVSRAPTEEMSFLNQLLADLRNSRTFIYVSVLAVTLLATTYYLLSPNQYTATAKLMPVSASASVSTGSALSGMLEGSALSGLLSSRIASESALYVELLKVRPVVDRVLERRFTDVLDGKNGTLTKLWETNNIEIARRKLLGLCEFSANSKTNVVTVSATTECPNLSAQIANCFAAELDRHKQSLDRSMAEEANIYFASKVAQQEEQVREDENKAAAFCSVNRNYEIGDDPVLKIEVERLERNVVFQRQVLAELLQLKVTSEMERERELPKLTVIEGAEPPLLKSGPRRVTSMAVVALMSIVFAVGTVAARSAYRWHIPLSTRLELSAGCSVVGSDATHFAIRMIHPVRRTKLTGV